MPQGPVGGVRRTLRGIVQPLDSPIRPFDSVPVEFERTVDSTIRSSAVISVAQSTTTLVSTPRVRPLSSKIADPDSVIPSGVVDAAVVRLTVARPPGSRCVILAASRSR
jgi:hypothetical protein